MNTLSIVLLLTIHFMAAIVAYVLVLIGDAISSVKSRFGIPAKVLKVVYALFWEVSMILAIMGLVREQWMRLFDE